MTVVIHEAVTQLLNRLFRILSQVLTLFLNMWQSEFYWQQAQQTDSMLKKSVNLQIQAVHLNTSANAAQQLASNIEAYETGILCVLLCFRSHQEMKVVDPFTLSV